AIEEALRVKEKVTGTEVVLVSIGLKAAQEQLRTGLAMGADRAILVLSEEALEPLAVARIVHKLAETEKPDLIIMGKQAIDEGAEEGDEGDPGRRSGHRRDAAAQDPEARDAAQAHGRAQGPVGTGAGAGAAQRSEGDLSMGNVLVVAEHLHGKFPKTTLVGVA